MPKVIKRYGNRKLYDLEASTYVTLHEIAEMVKRGEDIQVIDNRSKEDLTAVTLTQIILEEEKSKRSLLPLAFLRRIIQQSGESISDLVQKVGPQSTVAPIREAVEDAEASVLGLLEKGEMTIDETRDRVREIFQTPQRGIEEFQKRFDERLRFAVEKMTGYAQIQNQVQELEAKVSELEAELSKKGRASARSSSSGRKGRRPRSPRAAASS